MTPKWFWSKVRKESSGCWVWCGTLTKKGYGRFQRNGKVFAAHRFAYFVTKGPVPKGLCILHSCDNPRCVRPKHLRAGTYQDNSDDRVRRDRVNAILTLKSVQEIRRRYKPGCRVNGQGGLAKEFGVTRLAIALAVHGKTWKAAKGKIV